MYIGNSPLTLDAKGRMMIPAKHRDALMAEGCLLLLPLPVWEKMVAQIVTWPSALSVWRRIYFSNAEPVTWDGAGRILIPPALRAKAQLDKNVELLGNGSHFEIWHAQLSEQIEDEKLAGEKPEIIQNFTF